MPDNNTPPIEPTPPTPAPPIEPTPAPDDGVAKRLRELEEQNKTLQRQLEAQKLDKAKEQQNWQQVAEHHEQKAKDFETKFSTLQETLLNEKKLNALYAEAQKQGINPASLPDLDLLDFPEVIVETTSTGRVNVQGADRAIARLKTVRPHWFSQGAPRVNGHLPETTAPLGAVTVADLEAASLKYQKSKSESDRKAYEELIYKFKSQRA